MHVLMLEMVTQVTCVQMLSSATCAGYHLVDTNSGEQYCVLSMMYVGTSYFTTFDDSIS